MITSIIIASILSLLVGFGVAAILYRPRLEVAKSRINDLEETINREREEFSKALSNLRDTFKGISADVLRESREDFLKQAEPKLSEQVRPLVDALRRYDEYLKEIEGKREKAYGGISSVLELLRTGHSELAKETTSLVNALRSPTARGRWGEMTLRRVVEIAGMSEHCDFDEQSSTDTDEGRQRPDMVVHIPGGKTIVVDSKAPIDAYMRAVESKDETSRQAALVAHAKAVHDHMRRLGAKSYWSQFESAPDFVVLFIPGESFFSAALEVDRTLIEEGMENRVILATPTTLIVLLRSFALGWHRDQLTENAQKISEAGKELYERLTKFSNFFGKVGASISNAAKSFNEAVSSWDARVIPGARKLKEFGATKMTNADEPEVPQIETMPREIAGAVEEMEKRDA